MKIEQIKKEIKPILRRHEVKRAGVYGSYARGEQKEKSDIDILIEYKNDNKSLFDIIGLQMELEKIIQLE